MYEMIQHSGLPNRESAQCVKPGAQRVSAKSSKSNRKKAAQSRNSP
jgi:hypothetical protein